MSRKVRWTCHGSVRGGCGKSHRSYKNALKCIERDRIAATDGYSDRKVEPVLVPDEPLFSSGTVVMTQGFSSAVKAQAEAEGCDPFSIINRFLRRHLSGDWGDICNEDCEANNRGLDYGNRLLSRYYLTKDQPVWVITEWDRSATTLLLPEEY